MIIVVLAGFSTTSKTVGSLILHWFLPENDGILKNLKDIGIAEGFKIGSKMIMLLPLSMKLGDSTPQ